MDSVHNMARGVEQSKSANGTVIISTCHIYLYTEPLKNAPFFQGPYFKSVTVVNKDFKCNTVIGSFLPPTEEERDR